MKYLKQFRDLNEDHYVPADVMKEYENKIFKKTSYGIGIHVPSLRSFLEKFQVTFEDSSDLNFLEPEPGSFALEIQLSSLVELIDYRIWEKLETEFKEFEYVEDTSVNSDKNRFTLDLREGIEYDFELEESAEVNEDWGSSDQTAMNQSMHKTLGNPTEFPGLTELEQAAEQAVDFYWKDWEEYKTDRQGLVDNAMRRYFQAYFPERYKGFQAMFAPKQEESMNESTGGYLRNLFATLREETTSLSQVSKSVSEDDVNELQGDINVLEEKFKAKLKRKGISGW